MNRETILAQFDQDTELTAEVLALFLERCPSMLSRIRSAIRSEDNQALQQAAHAFKGAAGNFHMDGVVDLARRLESVAKGRSREDAGSVAEALEQEIARLTPLLNNFMKDLIPCS